MRAMLAADPPGAHFFFLLHLPRVQELREIFCLSPTMHSAAYRTP